MELAGRFARHVYRPFWEQADSTIRAHIPSLPVVEQTFRIAGLLHDVGHLPYSHLADELFLKRHGLTHEKLGTRIIRAHLADTIKRIGYTPDGEAVEAPVDPEIVCGLIESGQETDLPMVWRALSSVLRGSHDADRMDFILRDGRGLGLEGISPHEIERLILTSFLYPEHGGVPVFCLDATSLPALITFLRQRQYLSTVAYYHRTVRVFEEQLRPELEALLAGVFTNDRGELLIDRELSDREFSDRLKMCDEDLVHCRLRQDKHGAWLRLQCRDLDWRLAYERVDPYEQEPAQAKLLTAEGVRGLLDKFSDDDVWILVEHYRAPSALHRPFHIFDRSTRTLSHVSASDFWKQGIVLFAELVKVYVRSSRVERLRGPVHDRMVEIMGASTVDRHAPGLLTNW